MSSDGKTLYSSTSNAVLSWAYDPATISVGTIIRTLVTGMANDNHRTRTLLLSQKVNEMLLVSRGSTSNLDPEAEKLASGHSQIRAFDLTTVPSAGYQYQTDGLRLGWGLRNSVGVAEHPITGGIYSVENSADKLVRKGKDIHEDNPAEELNFHGYLDGRVYAQQGGNYG